jgi:DNA-binding beta-propeller fold protein YncE
LTEGCQFPQGSNHEPSQSLILAILSLSINVLFALPVSARQLDRPAAYQSFPVGHGPRGVACDGANIWIVNSADNTVTKLRASDGALQGTFAVGDSPAEDTFDGANIWVTNSYDNTVTKLRASDGALLGTYPVGNYPLGIVSDGANVWVVNFGDDNVSRLRASDWRLREASHPQSSCLHRRCWD